MKIKVILIFLLMFLASSVITGNIAGASVPVNPSNVYIYSKYVNVTGGKIISSNNINMELVLAEHGNYKGFLHDLYTPGNPLYRHFINSSEFYRMFGPTQSAKRFIENWLIAKGFVIANSPSPFVIKFSGSPSTVYDTFHAMAVIVNRLVVQKYLSSSIARINKYLMLVYMMLYCLIWTVTVSQDVV